MSVNLLHTSVELLDSQQQCTAGAGLRGHGITKKKKLLCSQEKDVNTRHPHSLVVAM